VSFFSPDFPAQDPANFEPDARRGSTPSTFGEVVEGPVVLGRSKHAAVAIETIVAFPDAVRFDLVAMLLNPIADPDPNEPRPWSGTSPAFHCMWPPHDPGPGFVRFGMRFADNDRHDNLHHRGGAGSSGPTLGQAEFWVPRLPPPGPIELFVQWDAAGIPEQSTTIDADPIRTASSRCTLPWTP